MSNYTYSITTDFSGNFNYNNFLSEFYRSSISLFLLNIYTSDDNVDISFNTTLTTEQETTLNTLVANHDATPIYNLDKSDTIVNMTSNVTYYYKIASIPVYGEYQKSIQSINIISYMQNGNTSYDVQIYDSTNNKIISTQNFTNTDAQINDMGTLSNLPNKKSIFEIHVKSNKNKKDVTIETISVNYYK